MHAPGAQSHVAAAADQLSTMAASLSLLVDPKVRNRREHVADGLMSQFTLRFRDPRLELLYFEFRTLPGQTSLQTTTQFLAMHVV
jgi:hypothetical protein